MKKLTKYFLEGIAIIIPITITVYVFYWMFTSVDNLYPFKIPGIGIIITLAVVMIIGFIASNVFTHSAVQLVDTLFGKLPFIKIVYTSLKDLTGAFVGDKKKFNRPVLVKFSDESTIELIGFVTEDDLSNFGESGKVAVYIPQAYNFAGNLIVVPAANVKAIDAGAKEVMTFIVSGGLSKGYVLLYQ